MSTSTRPSRIEVMASLPVSIVPVRTSLGYLIALGLVAGIMVLLPIVYVALIALTAYGVYWHFAYSEWLDGLLDQARGKGKIFVLLLYAAPGIVGGVLVVFMLKPFFRSRSRRSVPNSVERSQEPLLFEYIGRLCDVMRSPRPIRIDIDQEVNASAGFATGWSVFTNRLVLTIGLPLAEGLTLPQFTSVIAHEFGHFSQFWAMRFYFIIESINHWFRRVSVERDALDRKLSKASSELPSQLSWVLLLAELMVWCVRKILTGFRYLGLFVSRSLSRHMEFDADQYAARVSGIPSTVAAFERIGLLSVAETIAKRSSSQFLREGRALDNFPMFVAYQADVLPTEQTATLIEALHSRPAEWTSTHPSTAERIRRIRASGSDTSCENDFRASCLFADSVRVCRELTRKSYRTRSGAEPELGDLTSVDELIVEETERREKFESARRLVMYADVALIKWKGPILPWETELTVQQLEAEIRSLHQQQERGRAAYLAQSEQWLRFGELFDDWMLARVILLVRGRIRKNELAHIPATIKTLMDLDEWKKQPQNEESQLEEQMAAYELVCTTLFLRSLQLAVQRGADGSQLSLLWGTSVFLGSVSDGVINLHRRLQQLEWLFAWLADHPDDPNAKACIEKVCPIFIDEFQEVYGTLSRRPYPFPLSSEPDHLSSGLLMRFTDQSNPYLLYVDISRYCSGYKALHRRVIGELAMLVEAATGASR